MYGLKVLFFFGCVCCDSASKLKGNLFVKAS